MRNDARAVIAEHSADSSPAAFSSQSMAPRVDDKDTHHNILPAPLANEPPEFRSLFATFHHEWLLLSAGRTMALPRQHREHQ
jgi:hypothetical protein